jgi:hypothetical protein
MRMKIITDIDSGTKTENTDMASCFPRHMTDNIFITCQLHKTFRLYEQKS